jgi:glycosyltransferase involved in cell wall biosynthesis
VRLSVIVPVLNEARTLAKILDRVLAVPVVSEVIVVDDGSTDETFAIAESYAARSAGTAASLDGAPTPAYPGSAVEAASHSYTDTPKVAAARHERNRGKGAAIRTGLEHVTGDYVVIQDGDLEYDPVDFIKMAREAEKGASVVYGSRILGKNRFSYLRFYFGGRVLSILTNLFYGAGITDEPTCYKMIRTDLLRRMDLQCERFEFCPEVTAKAARLGARITEVPISYAPRSISEGKKIRWTDGWEAVETLWRYRRWTPGQG